MKRLGHVRDVLLALTSLTCLVVMIDGRPPSRGRLACVPDDNDDYYLYYGFDHNEPGGGGASAANRPATVIGERFTEDGVANEQIKPSETNIKLKKKNSEIISALMGLRKAMSSNYGVRQVHN